MNFEQQQEVARGVAGCYTPIIYRSSPAREKKTEFDPFLNIYSIKSAADA